MSCTKLFWQKAPSFPKLVAGAIAETLELFLSWITRAPIQATTSAIFQTRCELVPSKLYSSYRLVQKVDFLSDLTPPSLVLLVLVVHDLTLGICLRIPLEVVSICQ